MGNAEINELTKESIYLALVELMQTMPFEKITITTITKRAGVSRTAFYRNYETKGQILTTQLDLLFERYLDEAAKNVVDITRFSKLFFDYFKENSVLIQAIIDASMENELLQKFSLYLKQIVSELSPKTTVHTVEQEKINEFVVGGLFNLLINWVRSGMKETPEQMAAVVKTFDSLFF